MKLKRFVLAGAFLGIVAILLLYFGSKGGKSPVNRQKETPKPAAVANNVLGAAGSLVQVPPAQATFLVHQTVRRPGPAAGRCYTDPANAALTYSQTELAYKDDTYQAWYTTQDQKTPLSSYYGEHLNGEIMDWANVFGNTEGDYPLNMFLNVADLVNDKGQPISRQEALKPVSVSGVDYLRLYLAYKQSEITKERFCDNGQKAFVVLGMRADNYKEVQFRLSLNDFSDQNVVYETDDSYLYYAGPFSKYEPIFTAAGFNKAQAIANTAKVHLADPNAPRTMH